eukprot:767436-Hanusia_phi.AAC.12
MYRWAICQEGQLETPATIRNGAVRYTVPPKEVIFPGRLLKQEAAILTIKEQLPRNNTNRCIFGIWRPVWDLLGAGLEIGILGRWAGNNKIYS